MCFNNLQFFVKQTLSGFYVCVSCTRNFARAADREYFR